LWALLIELLLLHQGSRQKKFIDSEKSAQGVWLHERKEKEQKKSRNPISWNGRFPAVTETFFGFPAETAVKWVHRFFGKSEFFSLDNGTAKSGEKWKIAKSGKSDTFPKKIDKGNFRCLQKNQKKKR